MTNIKIEILNRVHIENMGNLNVIVDENGVKNKINYLR